MGVAAARVPARLRPDYRWRRATYLLAALLGVTLLGMAVDPGGAVWAMRMLHSGVDYHPDSTHSLMLDGYRSVICARNTGIYVGALFSVAWLWVSGRGRMAGFPPLRVTLLLALGFAAMAFDGWNSLMLDLGRWHPYTPNNELRLATGLLAGTAVGPFLVPVLGTLLWREMYAAPSVASLRQLGALLVPSALLWAGAASGLGVLALPVAVLTTAASIVLFGAVNLIVVLSLAGYEPAANDLRPAARLLLAATVLTLAELGALAFLVQAALGLRA